MSGQVHWSERQDHWPRGSGSLAKASESFATGGRPIDSKFKCVGLVYNDTRLVVRTQDSLSGQAFSNGRRAGGALVKASGSLARASGSLVETVRIIGQSVRIIGQCVRIIGKSVRIIGENVRSSCPSLEKLELEVRIIN